MKKILVAAITGLAIVLSCSVRADSKATIEEALKQALPGVKPDSIKLSPMAGLYEVMVGPKLFYVSEDGRYLIQGSLIDIQKREDLTEARLSDARLNALKKVGLDKMVVFKPKIQKHVAYVFTDIDCGYCRKLHSEID
jgi:thiol:disulfide interchange protein DsbC